MCFLIWIMSKNRHKHNPKCCIDLELLFCTCVVPFGKLTHLALILLYKKQYQVFANCCLTQIKITYLYLLLQSVTIRKPVLG